MDCKTSLTHQKELSLLYICVVCNFLNKTFRLSVLVVEGEVHRSSNITRGRENFKEIIKNNNNKIKIVSFFPSSVYKSNLCGKTTLSFSSFSRKRNRKIGMKTGKKKKKRS